MEQQPETNERNQTPETNPLFRQKSIDRISSPEQMNEYIRVASPKMWTVLIAVIIFLISILVWAVFGVIASVVDGVAIIEDGKCTVYVTQENGERLAPDDSVVVDSETSRLISISYEPFTVTDSFPEYAKSLGDFDYGEWICACEVEDVQLPDGIYSAYVTEESISPLSLLTEKN